MQKNYLYLIQNSQQTETSPLKYNNNLSSILIDKNMNRLTYKSNTSQQQKIEFQQFQYRINETDIKDIIQKQLQQSNKILKKQTLQILKNQKLNIKQYTIKDKQNIFNHYWKNLIYQLKNIMNNDSIFFKKLQITKNYYQFLLKINGKFQRQLNLFSSQREQSKEKLTKRNQAVYYIQPIQKKIKEIDDFLTLVNQSQNNSIPKQFPYTKYKYFNIDAFFSEKSTDIYSLTKQTLINTFNLKSYLQKNTQLYKTYHSKIGIKQIITDINKKIEQQFKFNFDTFQKTLKQQNKSTLTKRVNKIIRFFIKKYQLLKKPDEQPNFINKNWKYKLTTDVQKSIIKSINWQTIQHNLTTKTASLTQSNKTLCHLLNTDLQKLNIKISSTTNIIQIFQISFKHIDKQKNYFQLKQQLFQSLSTIDSNLIFKHFKSLQEFNQKIHLLEFFDRDKLIDQLNANSIYCQHQSFVICKTYDQRKYEKECFEMQNQRKKLINNKNFQKQICQFIKRKSVGKFIHQIKVIVQTVIEKWKGEISNRTVQYIFSLVNSEICAFNNDLSQISHQLSNEVMYYVHLLVLCMIWKLQIDQQIKGQQSILEEQRKKQAKALKNFMDSTSNQFYKVTSAEVAEFKKRVLKEFQKIIDEKKQQCMENHILKFKRANTRKAILQNVPVENLLNQSVKGNLWQNLVNTIQQKYQQCYKQQFLKSKQQFDTKKYNQQLTNQLTYICQHLYKQIVQKYDNKQQTIKNCYQHFFNKFISIQNQIQSKIIHNFHYSNINLSNKFIPPKSLIHIILENLYHDQVQLTVTCLPMFLAQLRESYFFSSQLQKICQFTKKHQIQFSNKIRVLTCKYQCSQCQQICTQQKPHNTHKCPQDHNNKTLADNEQSMSQILFLQQNTKYKQDQITKQQQNLNHFNLDLHYQNFVLMRNGIYAQYNKKIGKNQQFTIQCVTFNS